MLVASFYYMKLDCGAFVNYDVVTRSLDVYRLDGGTKETIVLTVAELFELYNFIESTR